MRRLSNQRLSFHSPQVIINIDKQFLKQGVMYNKSVDNQREEVSRYIENAHEMLEAAHVMLDKNFYTSAINRSYYAIFYAANALLATKGVSQGKHTRVISAFRQYFIKTGIFPAEYSQIYGRAMEDRHESDYDIGAEIIREDADENLVGAEQFVQEIEQWLKKQNWL